jgi:hypothetical protein
LTPPRDQIRKCLCIWSRQAARFRADALSKQRDNLGIERIGLRQPPGGTSEIPNLTRINNGER